MAEKKATAKKATETKAAAAKKTTTAKKAAAPKAEVKSVLAVNAEIAKAAKISEEETLLGLGWLFKEGKLANDGEKVTLA